MAPTRTRGATAPAPELNGASETGIEVEGGTPTEDAITVEADGAAPPQNGDEGIEALRRQLAEANQRAENAERDRDQLRSARAEDQTVIADSRLQVIDGVITTKEGELAAIKARIKTAMEEGNYDAQVDAQAELAQVTLDLKQARTGKARLEGEIEEARNTSADPIEKFIKDNNTHPKAANWLRQHPNYLTDVNLNKDLVRANFYALGAGAEVNSDQYFQLLEEKLGLREAAAPEERQQFEQQPQRQTSIPAAPVTRSAPTSTIGREVYPGVVHMGGEKYKVTPQVQEAAEMAGLTVKQWIAQALRLQRGPDGQMH